MDENFYPQLQDIDPRLLENINGIDFDKHPPAPIAEDAPGESSTIGNPPGDTRSPHENYDNDNDDDASGEAAIICRNNECDCGSAFTKAGQLTRHIAMMTALFPCDVCELDAHGLVKRFGSRNDQQRHYREVHGMELDGQDAPKFPCPHVNCDRHRRPFPRKQNLQAHLTKRHAGMMPSEHQQLASSMDQDLPLANASFEAVQQSASDNARPVSLRNSHGTSRKRSANSPVRDTRRAPPGPQPANLTPSLSAPPATTETAAPVPPTHASSSSQPNMEPNPLQDLQQLREKRTAAVKRYTDELRQLKDRFTNVINDYTRQIKELENYLALYAAHRERNALYEVQLN